MRSGGSLMVKNDNRARLTFDPIRDLVRHIIVSLQYKNDKILNQYVMLDTDCLIFALYLTSFVLNTKFDPYYSNCSGNSLDMLTSRHETHTRAHDVIVIIIIMSSIRAPLNQHIPLNQLI